jgi:hypothetical protein
MPIGWGYTTKRLRSTVGGPPGGGPGPRTSSTKLDDAPQLDCDVDAAVRNNRSRRPSDLGASAHRAAGRPDRPTIGRSYDLRRFGQHAGGKGSA